MAFHHVAISTRDLDATHRFYTEVMGFELLRVDAAATPEALYDEDPAKQGGWARHVFYDTGGGQCLAVWDFHDPDHLAAEFDPSISRGLGLPPWTNHIAFDAVTLDDLATHRDRWVAHGLPVVEIDHGWCTSIYVEDPNGITIEYCATTGSPRTADAAHMLADAAPALEPSPEPRFHVPDAAATTS